MSRKNYVDDYAISLDIGNASVGWSAFTPNYRLVRAKGHELIGVRLFDPADTAESRRMARTTRRRYSRRRCLKLILHFWLVGSILGSILMMKTMRIVGTVVFCLIQTNRTNVFMRNTQLFITCAKH